MKRKDVSLPMTLIKTFAALDAYGKRKKKQKKLKPKKS